eukprot:1588296-Lingulodinium_polyedra.AAC.1
MGQAKGPQPPGGAANARRRRPNPPAGHHEPSQRRSHPGGRPRGHPPGPLPRRLDLRPGRLGGGSSA